MSKRNVAFIKPEEPNFLKRIKQEIGYKEPDTIEAKVIREKKYIDIDRIIYLHILERIINLNFNFSASSIGKLQ